MVIWRISDGKAGHVNQLNSLVDALQQRQQVEEYILPTPKLRTMLLEVAKRRFTIGKDLPDPTLIACAGHSTHLAALWARAVRGGRVITVMKPTMPMQWFDLCIVPDHDGVRERPGVLVTRGSLNAMGRSSSRDANRALLLIGGPSRHYRWSDEKIMGQLKMIADRDPHLNWSLISSRRTPQSLISRLRECAVLPPGMRLHDERVNDSVFLELARVSRVWVTEDSMSMTYEAITAGGAVGLLEVPRRRNSRVTRGVDNLIAKGWVTAFKQWEFGELLTPAPLALDEARRCADWICERFLTDDLNSNNGKQSADQAAIN